MSPKSIAIILLAMSGSFITILSVLGYLIGADGPGGKRSRQRQTTGSAIVAPPVPALRSHPLDVARGRDTEPSTRAAPLDVPSSPQPFSGDPVVLPPVADKDPEISLLARVTERRLHGVESALSQQVATLKKSRDEMLDELAGQLASVSVQEASATVASLDDETAALTLQRFGGARRSAVLRDLPAKRRAAIEVLLKKKP